MEGCAMSTGNASGVPLDPGAVFGMLTAQQQSAALATAIELDVFRAVGAGPGDVASIAKHCGASERGTRILCDFLTIHGVLTKVDGRYQHTEMSAAFLDPPPPAASFSMTMLTTTEKGDAYPFSELKKMYEAAGFKDVTAQPVPRGVHTAVIGRK
jgi:hypothetical protein